MALKAGFWTAGMEGTAARMNNSMLQLADALVNLPAASSALANVCYYVTGVGIYQCQDGGGGSYSWVLLANHRGAAALDQNTSQPGTIMSSSDAQTWVGSAQVSVPAGSDYDLTSLTQAYDSSSLMLLYACVFGWAVTSSIKIRLYADGVQKAESSYLNVGGSVVMLTSYASLSGSKTVKISAHNYTGAGVTLYLFAAYGTPKPVIANIHAGSVKVL